MTIRVKIENSEQGSKSVQVQKVSVGENGSLGAPVAEDPVVLAPWQHCYEYVYSGQMLLVSEALVSEGVEEVPRPAAAVDPAVEDTLPGTASE